MGMRGVGCLLVSVVFLGTPAKADDLAAAYEALYSSITGGSMLVKCGASTLRVSRGIVGGVALEMMSAETGKWEEQLVTAHSDSRVTYGDLQVSPDAASEMFAKALSKAIAGRSYDGGFGSSFNYRPNRKDFPLATAEAVIDFYAGTLKVQTTEGATVVWDFKGLKEWEVVTTIPSGTIFQELTCDVRQ